MSKVILEGYIVVSEADLMAVKRALVNHIQLTREEDGCIVFDVSQDSENENRFNVYEAFSSESAFELHQQRVRSSAWGKASKEVKRYYQVSKVS